MLFMPEDNKEKYQYDIVCMIILGGLATSETLYFLTERSIIFHFLCYLGALVGCVLSFTGGVYSLNKSTLPKSVTVVLTAYIVMICIYGGIWIKSGIDHPATYLVNPVLSIPTWLLIGLIPLANLNLCTHVIFPTVNTTAKLALVFAILFGISSCKGVYKEIYFDPRPFIILLWACVLCDGRKEITQKFAYAILFVCLTVSFIDGLRSYIITTVFVSFLYLYPKFGIRTRFFLICFSFLALFAYIFLGRMIQYFGDNTRTYITLELLYQLSPHELLLGRGLGGRYFSYFNYLMVLKNNIDIAIFRSMIEVGFLCIILKIGIIGAIMFVYMMCYTQFVKVKKNIDISTGYLNFILAMFFLLFFELPHQASFGYGLWFTCCGLSYYHARGGTVLVDRPV